MHLDYLLFDATDDEAGACGFDAMASVTPAHLPGLVREIEAVLGWACAAFGPPAAAEDEGDWGFALQAWDAADQPLDIAYDLTCQRVELPHGGNPPGAPNGRVTVTLTLSGSRAFGEAWSEAFPATD